MRKVRFGLMVNGWIVIKLFRRYRSIGLIICLLIGVLVKFLLLMMVLVLRVVRWGRFG